ncbi:MAG: RluA family pseudouridine synthase [Polyangiaceae bacterium]
MRKTGTHSDAAAAPAPSGTSAASYSVTAEFHRKALDAVVRHFRGCSWNTARDAVRTGKVSISGQVETEPTRFVREGDVVTYNAAARKPRPSEDLPKDAILYSDAHVIVVHKPPGMSTVPFDENEAGTGTLDERLRAWLARENRNARVGVGKGSKASKGGSGGLTRQPPSLGVVHRIDKETSGVLVFTRTWLAKQSLAAQFRAHTVHRKYLAIVHGAARSATHESHLLEDRGDGLRGSYEARARRGPKEGQLAITHVELLERFEGASLVSCRLETGRTHQIRIHLSEAGNPLLGERVYIRNYRGSEIPAPRLMLHAAELGFVHPVTEKRIDFVAPMPDDMRGVLARLTPVKRA